MFNKSVDKVDTSLLSILSNSKLAEFLDGLTWEYDEFYRVELITMKIISVKSVIMASVIQNMTKFKLEDVSYSKNGHILYRRHPRLPIRKKEIKKSFTITKRSAT